MLRGGAVTSSNIAVVILLCRDGTCGGPRIGVDQALAWRGAVSGVVCQFRIVGSVQFPPVTRIKSLRTPNKVVFDLKLLIGLG